MKLPLKNRLAILDRAFDKAAKIHAGDPNPLAPMEAEILGEALAHEQELIKELRLFCQEQGQKVSAVEALAALSVPHVLAAVTRSLKQRNS